MIRPQQEMFYGHQELCDDRKKLDFLPIQDFFNLDVFMVSHFNNSNASVGKVKESVKN